MRFGLGQRVQHRGTGRKATIYSYSCRGYRLVFDGDPGNKPMTLIPFLHAEATFEPMPDNDTTPPADAVTNDIFTATALRALETNDHLNHEPGPWNQLVDEVARLMRGSYAAGLRQAAGPLVIENFIEGHTDEKTVAYLAVSGLLDIIAIGLRNRAAEIEARGFTPLRPAGSVEPPTAPA